MSYMTAPSASCRSFNNRAFRRLCYEVLDHAPTHRDIRRFFRRFRAALTGRGLTLRGVTTDGSDLYPRPISEVFGAVEHQVCRFHILAELNKAVLRAIARVRKHLAAQQPELPRGAPAHRRRDGRPGDAGICNGRSGTCSSIAICS